MATAFGGLATPPGTCHPHQHTHTHTHNPRKEKKKRRKLTFNTTLPNQNAHRPCLLHSAATPSKSNNSPIGIPQPASSHWCSTCAGSWCAPMTGPRSKLGASLAAAANPAAHSHRSVARVASRPTKLGSGRAARACWADGERALRAASVPVRRSWEGGLVGGWVGGFLVGALTRMSPRRGTVCVSRRICWTWASGMGWDEKGSMAMPFAAAKRA